MSPRTVSQNRTNESGSMGEIAPTFSVMQAPRDRQGPVSLRASAGQTSKSFAPNYAYSFEREVLCAQSSQSQAKFRLLSDQCRADDKVFCPKLRLSFEREVLRAQSPQRQAKLRLLSDQRRANVEVFCPELFLFFQKRSFVCTKFPETGQAPAFI